jgi:basic amino acid/polyamine antiporter, APA family
VAGQARAGSRAVPLAVLGSLAIPALLYVALQRACVLAVPDLAASASPLVEAAGVFGGPSLATAVGVGTSVSALGIAFGMVAMTPRYLSSLARGGVLGLSLDSIAPNGVPLRALAATWALVILLLQIQGQDELFALSSVAVLAQYVVTAGSLWVLARRGFGGLPRGAAWLAPPAAAVGLALASGATRRELGVAAAALVLGLTLRVSSRYYQRRSGRDA